MRGHAGRVPTALAAKGFDRQRHYLRLGAFFVAEPRRQSAPATRDRRSDMEALGATIFVQKFVASGGSRDPSTLAREALTAARAVYAVCDPSASEKGS